jgi:predicted RNase H-like nuclease (RuvC/YqgF family)
MQEQINAIKQLLEINNITGSQIDEILIKALALAFCNEVVDKRDRQIGELQAEINRLKSWLKKREDQLQALWANDTKDPDIETLRGDVKDLCDRLRTSANQISDRDRQIQELQITVKNHGEQFENLKSHFEVLLKAIAMNLNGLKGDRKPDHVETVDGVEIRYRRYDDNLTHHGKTLIIENQQRVIAEEAKKLKGIDLKDFSFDDDEIPF